MATLNSPGVSVTLVDESFYGSSGQGTVPFIMIATAQDKLNAAGTEIAEGTKLENAGKLYQVSSQRELLQFFGNPEFYDVNGTALHGYPLNEYGLLAAHSYLGVANRAYVMRADIDLSQLQASDLPPKSKAEDGTYWLKTDTINPALYEYSTASSKWVKKDVYVTDGVDFNEDLSPSILDLVPRNVPSNYNYAMVAGPFPLEQFILYLNPGWTATQVQEFKDANKDFFMLNNVIAKRNGTTWKWFVGSALGGGDEFDEDAFQFSDVYPTLRRDGLTANQNGDVWFNTRENVYDLRLYNGTSDSYSTVTFPINVSYNEGLSYYKNLNRSPKDVAVGDVIAISGDNFAYAALFTNYVGAVNFYKWTGVTYEYAVSTYDGSVALPSTNIDFILYTDPTYQVVTVTISGSISNIINIVNSNATLQTYGVSLTYDYDLMKFKLESAYDYSYAVVAPDIGFPAPVGSFSAFEVSGWELIAPVPSASAPAVTGVNGTYWYSEDFKVDILVNDGTGNWDDPSFDVYLQPSEPVSPSTDDLWIDTTNVNEYPYIQRYDGADWVLVDNTDQTTPDGIIFADCRKDPSQLATALDADAPDPLRYPGGMLLFNTRYSTRNVKQYVVNKFPENAEGDRDRWVSISGLKPDGSPYMGQDAVYRVIAISMQAAMSSSDTLRSEDIFFNIIATPGFPELIDEMLTLNVDRKETAFVIGDCPFDLEATTQAVTDWASNANNAITNGQDGLITADENLAVYYPCGVSTNVDGTEVVVPPSHMMLRTYAYNDQVAYQWFAPAGLQRGVISNATNVGYVSAEGEFVPASLSEGMRDALYLNNINPIRQMINRGPVAWGQKTRSPVSSALDRVNVARLVNYIRYQAPKIVEPFLFEQNDKLTRKSAKAVVDAFMSELVSLRGVYDWVTVCDESNNTPARIDRNELWIDIALKPAKTIEFIYIPIRLKRTGDDLTI